MTNAEIHAVLFDYGGVIAEEGFYHGLISLAEEQALDAKTMPQQGMDAVYDSGFVLGRGSVNDFWSLLRQRTGLEGDDELLTERVLEGFQIRIWVIELVRKLRAKGYLAGILSDQTPWLDELDKVDHFYQEFDHVFNSYYRGKGKRDASLFTDVVTELGLEPAQVLLVDDNEDNVQRAKQMGLNAIHYTSHSDFILALERVLAEEFSH